MESENVTIGSHKRADYSLLEKKLEENIPISRGAVYT